MSKVANSKKTRSKFMQDLSVDGWGYSVVIEVRRGWPLDVEIAVAVGDSDNDPLPIVNGLYNQEYVFGRRQSASRNGPTVLDAVNVNWRTASACERHKSNTWGLQRECERRDVVHAWETFEVGWILAN